MCTDLSTSCRIRSLSRAFSSQKQDFGGHRRVRKPVLSPQGARDPHGYPALAENQHQLPSWPVGFRASQVGYLLSLALSARGLPSDQVDEIQAVLMPYLETERGHPPAFRGRVTSISGSQTEPSSGRNPHWCCLDTRFPNTGPGAGEVTALIFSLSSCLPPVSVHR